MTKALIVIDVQNDFCPGGALAVAGGDEIVPGINALMPEFAAVILTQDWHPSGHSSFASSHAGNGAFEVFLFVAGVAPDVLRHEGQRWENQAAQAEVERALAAEAEEGGHH